MAHQMIHNKIVDLRNSGEKRSVILPRETCKENVSHFELLSKLNVFVRFLVFLLLSSETDQSGQRYSLFHKQPITIRLKKTAYKK